MCRWVGRVTLGPWGFCVVVEVGVDSQQAVRTVFAGFPEVGGGALLHGRGCSVGRESQLGATSFSFPTLAPQSVVLQRLSGQEGTVPGHAALAESESATQHVPYMVMWEA